MAQQYDDRIKVIKWNGRSDTWSTWKRKFSTSMILKGLGNYLHTDNPPVKPQQDAQNAAAISKYDGENLLLWGAIDMAIPDHIAARIRASGAAEGDGITAWKVLVQDNEKKDRLRATNLRTQLGLHVMEEDGELDSYLEKLFEISRNVQIAEGLKELPNELMITQLFAGLNSSYKHWVHSKFGLENLKYMDLTLELKSISEHEKAQTLMRANAQQSSFYTKPHGYGQLGRQQHGNEHKQNGGGRGQDRDKPQDNEKEQNGRRGVSEIGSLRHSGLMDKDLGDKRLSYFITRSKLFIKNNVD